MEWIKMGEPDEQDFAGQIRYLYTQDWLKSEIVAGRYRDPIPELGDMLPAMGDTPDPTVERPSLTSPPDPPVHLPSGQVYLTDSDRRYCARVARARTEYKTLHYDEMTKWIEERPRTEYIPEPLGDSLRTLEQGIRDNDLEIQALYQQYEPPEREEPDIER
jgi:hypothetical protein